jgi:hypothetical protein
MRPRLRYSTNPATIMKLAKSQGRDICWVLRHLLWGAPTDEQRRILRERVDAFREVYGMASYKALLAEARRCGFFPSRK